MNVKLLSAPTAEDLLLLKRAIWVTMGKRDEPRGLPSDRLLHAVLEARHSPARLLRFVFLIEDIPSNTSVHLCRHVHAIPFVSSLRNDRQQRMDGDKAPRDTPVDMMYAVNAEELMVIANKRLCFKAAARTRQVVREMCRLAEDALPQLEGLLVPMCEYHGGVCHEIETCGRCPKA